MDSVFSKLKVEEKIGQLLIIPISSYSAKEEINLSIELAKDKKISGLLITKSGPLGYGRLLNRFQSQSVIPLLSMIFV